MTLWVPCLMLSSLVLLSAGFALLLHSAAEEEVRERSPAELSTSRPAPRPCWAGLRARWQARACRPRVRAGAGCPAPREPVLEMAEVSAARTLFTGRISQL